MKWLEIKITTSPEYEDLISAILYDLGAKGLDIKDPQDVIDITENQEKKDWDFIDEKLLKLDMGIIEIKTYFSEKEDLEKIKEKVIDKIEKTPYLEKGIRYGEVEFDEIEDKDWSEEWKKGYKPMRVGKNVVIKPSWEEYEEKENDLVIELDPGMAFGTGDHETTYMCIEAIEEYIKKGDLVYDVGCGSGILGIAASKLGAEKVIGVDLDPVCVDVSNENVKRNNVEDNVNILHGNLLDVVKDKADLVVANIIAEIIVDLSDDLSNYLKLNGMFIGSGIIIEKIDMVVEALEKNNFKILDIRKMNGWSCVIARK